MRLEWAWLALQDRHELFDYISRENSDAAIAIDEHVERAVERLLSQPRMGRTGRIRGTRELAIGQTPYIAVYRLMGDRLVVLRILHGARQWPDEAG